MEDKKLFKDEFYFKTDRIESGQLAAQVGDEDNDDWLLVAAFLEELVDGDSGLSVGGFVLHLFQFAEHFVCTAPQSLQGCRVKTSSSFKELLWYIHKADIIGCIKSMSRF